MLLNPFESPTRTTQTRERSPWVSLECVREATLHTSVTVVSCPPIPTPHGICPCLFHYQTRVPSCSSFWTWRPKAHRSIVRFSSTGFSTLNPPTLFHPRYNPKGWANRECEREGWEALLRISCASRFLNIASVPPPTHTHPLASPLLSFSPRSIDAIMAQLPFLLFHGIFFFTFSARFGLERRGTRSIGDVFVFFKCAVFTRFSNAHVFPRFLG